MGGGGDFDHSSLLDRLHGYVYYPTCLNVTHRSHGMRQLKAFHAYLRAQLTGINFSKALSLDTYYIVWLMCIITIVIYYSVLYIIVSPVV